MPATIDLKFILIQIVGLIGAGIYFLSYQFKENKKVFRTQIFSYIFAITHFILLGAMTGALSYLVNLLRSIFLSSDNKKLHSKWACVLICSLLVIVCVLTWSGPISLLPVIGNAAVTIGGYTHSEKKLRLSMLFINGPAWMAYDIIVKSWAGVFDETLTLIAVIVSIIRLGWSNLDKKE